MSNNDNLPAVLSNDRVEEIKKMMWDIPFGNTSFQIQHFLREYTNKYKYSNKFTNTYANFNSNTNQY